MKKTGIVWILILVLATAGAFAAAEGAAGDETPADGLAIDTGESALFTQEERETAVGLILAQFAAFEGTEMLSVRYAGDAACTEENVTDLSSARVDGAYDACMEFLTDFYSAGSESLEADTVYEDFQWWLGRLEDGTWELVTWGY